MQRYFTQYWSNETWKRVRNSGLDHSMHIAGNLFTQRGVSVGNVVFVVTVIDGDLYVGSKFIVGKICSVSEAAAVLNCDPEDLWEAKEHILASAATPIKFDLKIRAQLARQLRFVRNGKIKLLKFKSANRLDEQTLRGVREIEPASALELDRLLPPLEKAPLSGLLNTLRFLNDSIPEEIDAEQNYFEGALKQITVNVYERNTKARDACKKHYGINCVVCNFNFETVYGDLGSDFINIHHLTPLPEIREDYQLDPIRDLRPVCPNCHAMIHRRIPAHTIEEVKSLLVRNDH